MGEGTDSPILIPVLILAFASIALAALAIHLGRSGKVRSTVGRFALVVLALAPLFGGGLFLYVRHIALRAADETAAGVNGIHPGGNAPALRQP